MKRLNHAQRWLVLAAVLGGLATNSWQGFLGILATGALILAISSANVNLDGDDF